MLFLFAYILFLFMYVCMYVWLCWVFVSVRGLSLVVASGGHSSSRCAGLSLSRPLLLPSTGSRRAGSVIVAHRPSCSAACGIFPDQGSNLRPLHWQADSQPLCHQGSPEWNIKGLSSGIALVLWLPPSAVSPAALELYCYTTPSFTDKNLDEEWRSFCFPCPLGNI